MCIIIYITGSLEDEWYSLFPVVAIINNVAVHIFIFIPLSFYHYLNRPPPPSNSQSYIVLSYNLSLLPIGSSFPGFPAAPIVSTFIMGPLPGLPIKHSCVPGLCTCLSLTLDLHPSPNPSHLLPLFNDHIQMDKYKFRILISDLFPEIHIDICKLLCQTSQVTHHGQDLHFTPEPSPILLHSAS